MHDPYEVLQIDRRAQFGAIRAAYRGLARRHHPDLGGDPEVMAAINAAWTVLRDPTRRADYDARTELAAAKASRAERSTDRSTIDERTGTVLEFGRYQGQTIASIGDFDPDYLEWLARTPVGRGLRVEIAAVLARQPRASTAPGPAPHRGPARRSFRRPWAASG